MNLVRQIHQLTSNTITITLPDSFNRQTVEILVWPVIAETPSKPISSSGWPADFFNQFAGALPDFPEINREKDYEQRENL